MVFEKEFDPPLLTIESVILQLNTDTLTFIVQRLPTSHRQLMEKQTLTKHMGMVYFFTNLLGDNVGWISPDQILLSFHNTGNLEKALQLF